MRSEKNRGGGFDEAGVPDVRIHPLADADETRPGGRRERGGAGHDATSALAFTRRTCQISVVVTSLKEADAPITDQVDESVLLREAARPGSRREVPERLGFPQAAKGSRSTASIRSNARRAVLRFVATQNRRSSRNSG
jgi:hypothetical protein